MKRVMIAIMLLFLAATAEAATNTLTTSGGNWSTTGNWSDGTPTADDDVVIPTGMSVTIDAAAVCRSVTLQGTATLTHGAYSLSIGDATAGSGNVALSFSSTSTYAISAYNTSVINFISSSSTTQTVDFSGHNTGNVTFGSSSVGGSYQLTGTWGTSAVAANQLTTITRGAFDANGQTIHLGRLSSIGAYTRSSSWNGSSVYFYVSSGASPAVNIGAYYNTFTQGTGTFYIVGAGNESYPCYVSGEMATFTNLVFTGTYGRIKSSGATVENLTVTPPSSARTSVFYVEGNITISGTVAFNGPSLTNRLLVASNVLGTQRTVTYNGTANPADTISNVDFRDMTVDGTYGDWDLSDITGGAGDDKGNGSSLILTPGVDYFWYSDNGGTNTTYNIYDYAHWYTATNGGGTQMSAGRTLMLQDVGYFDENSINGSGTTSIYLTHLYRYPTLDFSDVDTAVTLTAAYLSTFEIHGSLIFNSYVTTPSTYAMFDLIFCGRGAYLYTANTANATSDSTVTVNAYGGSLSLSGSRTLINQEFACYLGTTNFGDVTLYTNNTLVLASTATANLESSNLNLNGITVNSSTSFNAGTSTINLGYFYYTPQARTPKLAGAGKQFYNVNFFGTSWGTGTITGSNTFNTLTINTGSGSRVVNLTAGTTQTVNSLVATGTSGNKITLQSATADSLAYIYDANGGTNVNDYLDVIDVKAGTSSTDQTNTFYYGANGSGDNAVNWAATATVASRRRTAIFE